MLDIILNLDAHLQTYRADFYATLNPPLTTKAIHDLEQKYQTNIPLDVSALYKWKNGQSINCYEAFANNWLFTPLQDVLDTAATLTAMIGYDFDIENWWNKNWLPIFGNGGGDYICYDIEGTFTNQKGQILEFWHADNDRNVIAPTLEKFLAAISDYYNLNKAVGYKDEYPISYIKNYPIKFYV